MAPAPNVAYLARHGWDALGVDISPTAIEKAIRGAEGVAGAHFVAADVTKLTEAGITGPFDLVIDNGCYHTLSEAGKSANVREVAAVMPADAQLMMWEAALVTHPVIKVRPGEISERFAQDFVVECEKPKTFRVERMKIVRCNIKAKWYWLRRR